MKRNENAKENIRVLEIIEYYKIKKNYIFDKTNFECPR